MKQPNLSARIGVKSLLGGAGATLKQPSLSARTCVKSLCGAGPYPTPAWQQFLHWLSQASIAGCYAVLCTRDLLKLCSSHITFAADMLTVIQRLGFTKSSGQAGRQDSVGEPLPKLSGVLHAWRHDRRACDALVPVSATCSSFCRHFTALLIQLH